MQLNKEIPLSEDKKKQLLAEAGMPEKTAIDDYSLNDIVIGADLVVEAALDDVSPRLEDIVPETHGDLDDLVEEYKQGGPPTP